MSDAMIVIAAVIEFDRRYMKTRRRRYWAIRGIILAFAANDAAAGSESSKVAENRPQNRNRKRRRVGANVSPGQDSWFRRHARNCQDFGGGRSFDLYLCGEFPAGQPGRLIVR